MNINEKTQIWTQFKFQLPLFFCAIWIIVSQRKLIWSTLKMWFGWTNFGDWPPERVNYMTMFGVGAAAFILSTLVAGERQKTLVEQQKEVIDKMLEERLITPKELEEIKQKEVELAREKEKLGKKTVNLPFYNISRIFCFVSVVILAPLGEEAVFRYLIFEIFGKENPFSYLFSGLSFIFFHWLGPTLGFGGGLLNFTTIKFLFLSYLPMTIFFIWSYKKSNWNITYPMYFHFLWNFFVFLIALN